MNPLEDIRVITEKQAVALLGLSERTWERQKKAGDVPPKIRLSPRRIGYRVCDLRAWQDSRMESAA